MEGKPTNGVIAEAGANLGAEYGKPGENSAVTTDSSAVIDVTGLDESVANVVKRFKSVGDLAKAKISSDSEYSKLANEKKSIERMFSRYKFETRKEIVRNNPLHLVKLAQSEPELAEKIALELTDMPLDSVMDRIVQRIGSGTVDTDGSGAAAAVTKEDIDKIAEVKAAKILKARLDAEKSKADAESEKWAIESFMSENGIDESNKDAFMAIYKETFGDRKPSAENVKKYLKASLALFAEENEEFNAELVKKKANLAASAQSSAGNGSKAKGAGLNFSEDDLKAAKAVKMTIEEYLKYKPKRYV